MAVEGRRRHSRVSCSRSSIERNGDVFVGQCSPFDLGALPLQQFTDQLQPRPTRCYIGDCHSEACRGAT